LVQLARAYSAIARDGELVADADQEEDRQLQYAC
jgi:hypothetical protein